MAACSKSVNFPIRKLFESIPGLSPEDDAFSALKNPYVSDDTQQLFSIMIDRMDEQLRACGVYEARYDNNFRMITKEKYNYISKVRVHHDAGFRELLNYETHRQYMNGINEASEISIAGASKIIADRRLRTIRSVDQARRQNE